MRKFYARIELVVNSFIRHDEPMHARKTVIILAFQSAASLLLVDRHLLEIDRLFGNGNQRRYPSC